MNFYHYLVGASTTIHKLEGCDRFFLNHLPSNPYPSRDSAHLPLTRQFLPLAFMPILAMLTPPIIAIG
jgi:hypothetical protein